MFYENKLKIKKVKEKTILFDKFQFNLNTDDNDNILAENITKLSYNFATNNGELATGYGFSALRLPKTDGGTAERTIQIFQDAEIYGLWHYKFFDEINRTHHDRLFWNNSNGFLVYCSVISYDTYSYEMSTLNALSSTPVGVNYTLDDIDYMLFSYDDGMFKITQNSASTHNTILPKFVSLVNAYSGLYAIIEGKRNKITYSDTLDPSNWTIDENVIDLTDERGSCNKLMYFNDYLYVFRDFGITKISKYSSSDTFSITNLFSTTSKIFGNTVVKCGDNIVFLAKNGLFSFNGNSTKKYDFDITNLFEVVDNNNATACFNGGKYFVACKLNFNDGTSVGCESYEGGYTNNAVIILDLLTNQISLMRGVDIHTLLSLNSGSLSTIVASFNGEHSKKLGRLDNTGKIFGTDLPKFWKSISTDFDTPNKRKIVKEICIKATNDCTLKIITDEETKEILVSGSTKIQKIRTSVKGSEIQTAITSNVENKITSLKIKVNIVE